MLKFDLQAHISQEKIDLERSLYACAKPNYMPKNNFSIPGH